MKRTAAAHHYVAIAKSATTLCIGALLSACGPSDGVYDITQDLNTIAVEIRRTANGVPYIVAKDVRSAAFGQSYAYAQDNICIAANQFISAAAERSKYLGAGTADANLRSDYYYRLVFDQALLERASAGLSAVGLDAIRGFVEGYNRFLADAKASDFAADCAPAGVPAD